jgi:hypothetical protein
VYICRVIYYDVYLQVTINNTSIFRKVEGLGTGGRRDFERCDIFSGIGIK